MVLSHNPTSTTTALLLHRNAATSPYGHCVNVADSNRADLNCDGSLEGDPLILARTKCFKTVQRRCGSWSINLKTSSVQVLKIRPGTLLIDRTKYASGVTGDSFICLRYSFFTNTLKLSNCERARIKEKIAATALKARVRSGSTLFLEHAQQGFETVAAKLRPSSKLSTTAL